MLTRSRPYSLVHLLLPAYVYVFCFGRLSKSVLYVPSVKGFTLNRPGVLQIGMAERGQNPPL